MIKEVDNDRDGKLEKSVYMSSEVANWNEARLKCKDDKLELFQLDEGQDPVDYQNVSSPTFWVGFNVSEDKTSNSCPLIEVSSWSVNFETEQCDRVHKFLCQETSKSERFLSTRNLLILVFSGVFIYFVFFFIHASRTQSKHELKQKKLNTELSEFNEELPETVESI